MFKMRKGGCTAGTVHNVSNGNEAPPIAVAFKPSWFIMAPMTRGLGLVAESECEAMATAAYHPVNLVVEPLAEMKDDDEPKSHWLKVPLSKTSALSVTENFVKKSNWFRSKKQRQLLEQMAQPQPLTGNIYRYMAALVNVATDQDPASNPDSSGCCTCCCDCRKCCSSSWWRLTPGRKRERGK